METPLPKDGRVMMAIATELGIQDIEPRVVTQLLEFSYRYSCTILEDAKNLSVSASKKNIDVDDIKLAVQMFAEQNLTFSPSRDVLLELARLKNGVPLPVPKTTSGSIRLPPDRYCLTAPNYRLSSSSSSSSSSVTQTLYTAYPRKIGVFGDRLKVESSSIANSSSLGGNSFKITTSGQQGQIQQQQQQQTVQQQQQPIFKIQVGSNSLLQLETNKRKRGEGDESTSFLHE